MNLKRLFEDNIYVEKIIQDYAQKKQFRKITKNLTQKEYDTILNNLKSKTTSQKLREYDLEGIPINKP